MDQDVDRPRPAPELSEDELAREMIARIARQVDLETGRVPIAEPEPEEEAGPTADEPTDEPIEAVAVARDEEDGDEPEERSEEDVSRDLVERIAREVDEEARG